MSGLADELRDIAGDLDAFSWSVNLTYPADLAKRIESVADALDKDEVPAGTTSAT